MLLLISQSLRCAIIINYLNQSMQQSIIKPFNVKPALLSVERLLATSPEIHVKMK